MITKVIYRPDVSDLFAPNRNHLLHICHLIRIAFVACLHLRADGTAASATSSFYQDQIFSTTPPTSFARSASCRRHSRSKHFPLMLRASSSSSWHRLRWSHRFRAPLPHLQIFCEGDENFSALALCDVIGSTFQLAALFGLK